jgi:predicted transcriptional regulator of viral defense system
MVSRSLEYMNVISNMTFMPTNYVLDRLRPLALAQLGHFTAVQAERVGVDRRYLAHHVRSGNLIRAARGVYRFRHDRPDRFEDVTVAVLWAGEQAVASHETALAIYGLASAMPAVIHLTLPFRFRGRRPGVIIHQAQLPPDDVTTEQAIPVTTPVRTLADVAGDRSVLIDALMGAFDRGLVRRRELDQLVARRPELGELVVEVASR